ncbi:hypothetical protein M427DRAFT_37516 [Gonapodya prolifera JEL478]|uniref:F-box domain-containing protein n=1 Tax=Gonapodya prolifera (strain JEL478) TaxID=1344416 RepID=A0A139A0Q2_GONPJ|nr:hypothetical protein M427DRAFT_37516 [Gonapodya prolifera JEL478]|eukprot:KXS10350.1 hypothetical protein M427DRAFT_37516 [Gonapodya prolifera JEL478]
MESLPLEILHPFFRLLPPVTFYATVPRLSRKLRNASRDVISGCSGAKIGACYELTVLRDYYARDHNYDRVIGGDERSNLGELVELNVSDFLIRFPKTEWLAPRLGPAVVVKANAWSLADEDVDRGDAERARRKQQGPTPPPSKSTFSNPPILRPQTQPWSTSPTDPSTGRQPVARNADGVTSSDFGRGTGDVKLSGGGDATTNLSQARANLSGHTSFPHLISHLPSLHSLHIHAPSRLPNNGSRARTTAAPIPSVPAVPFAGAVWAGWFGCACARTIALAPFDPDPRAPAPRADATRYAISARATF